MCGCLAWGVAGGAAAKQVRPADQRTRCGLIASCTGSLHDLHVQEHDQKHFGTHRPDLPRLPQKYSSKWGLEVQEQWVRREPVLVAHRQATSHSAQGNHQQTLDQQQQQDWHSAALQQSAQLDEIAKQELTQEDTLVPDSDRQKPVYMQRRAAAGQAASQDEDWLVLLCSKVLS